MVEFGNCDVKQCHKFDCVLCFFLGEMVRFDINDMAKVDKHVNVLTYHLTTKINRECVVVDGTKFHEVKLIFSYFKVYISQNYRLYFIIFPNIYI